MWADLFAYRSRSLRNASLDKGLAQERHGHPSDDIERLTLRAPG